MTSQYWDWSNPFEEFPLWLSGWKTWHRLHEDVNSTPGLAQWVKDLVLLRAVTWVANTARIQCCCDCGRGLSCSSDLTAAGVALKRKKKKGKMSKTHQEKWQNHFISIAFVFWKTASRFGLIWFHFILLYIRPRLMAQLNKFMYLWAWSNEHSQTWPSHTWVDELMENLERNGLW